MAKVILGMTISLDGYINDSLGSVGALYPDLTSLLNNDLMLETIQETGAVVMGRNSYAMAEDPNWYAGNYEFQVPIFVLAHAPPQKHPKEAGSLTFTFVTDGIESAVRQAKTAAGDKDVVIIGGASTAQQCLNAGLADEIHIDIMPVILGGGLRLFERIGSEKIQLERLKVAELPAGRTALRFRVQKTESH